MANALEQLFQLLEAFDCRVTLPITAIALARNSSVIQKYQARGIEFAVHGYTHIDYSQLSLESQLDHLRRARGIFARTGIRAVGFRSPYLRRAAQLDSALEATGFAYVSNQPILWDVLDTDAFPRAAQVAYQRAIAYYEPWRASERLSLPRFRNRLVEIPVSLPDDEILLDRLDGESQGLVKRAWRKMLSETYKRGELFTVQLHPERTALCSDGLSSVLEEARRLTPLVWLARMDEIADWWRARAAVVINIETLVDGRLRLSVAGPRDTTVLARGVEVDAPSVPWTDGYQKVEATEFTLSAPVRPFVGLSSSASPELASFLRQQGYIVEIGEERHPYACYLDQADFAPESECSLLAHLEEANRPLVRLGRWPKGARSALTVTGDVDALTLWDYGLRAFGR